MKWLHFALQNIWHNRRRSISSAWIIAVGTGAILLGGGFMLATYDALTEMAIRAEGHVRVAPLRADGALLLDRDRALSLRNTLLDDPRVKRVLPRLHFEGLVINGNHARAFLGTGVDAAEEFKVHGPFLEILSGDVLDIPMLNTDLPEVLLGDRLAQTLQATLGTRLALVSVNSSGESTRQQVQVVGTYRTGNPEIDLRTLMVSLDTAQQILKTDHVSTLSIYLHADHDSAAIKRSLDIDMEVSTWKERAVLYHDVRALYDRIFGAMGLIILVVVFLSIFNTAAMAVMERLAEIGTMAALGTGRGRILTNFVMEAILIAAAGIALGMVIAGTVAALIDAIGVMMPPPPGRSVGYPLYIYASPALYALSGTLIVVVATASACVATFRVTRIRIVDALR